MQTPHLTDKDEINLINCARMLALHIHITQELRHVCNAVLTVHRPIFVRANFNDWHII